MKNFKYIVKGRATRGEGVLERFLSLQRTKRAKQCIKKFLKRPHQKFLDIGCGKYPICLLVSDFAEKYGIDRQRIDEKMYQGRFRFIEQDISKNGQLPFPDQFFDAVSMLAVFEHLERPAVMAILKEIRRVLQPGGVLVLTTPGYFTESLLNFLASIKLLSSEEIDEHATNLKTPEIKRVLLEAGFKEVQAGSFQMLLNRWFVGVKNI
ncbi:MAG: class I SAM-dependent methyltransferase [Candidatus Omnitrophica bacterium]|nr:class I SAM-dependent methyltransferase [Candidatus Omnitrophota bacterium]